MQAINTLALSEVQAIETSKKETATTSSNTHMSLNNLGAVRVTVSPRIVTEELKRRRSRNCDCGTCMYCNDTQQMAAGVSISFNVQSYNAAICSDTDNIVFPSKEAFVEFKNFMATVDVDALFTGGTTPVANAA